MHASARVVGTSEINGVVGEGPNAAGNAADCMPIQAGPRRLVRISGPVRAFLASQPGGAAHDGAVALAGATRRASGWLTGLALLAACTGTTDRATLTGHIYMVGGPAATAPRAVSGTVTVEGADGSHTVTAGADGRYSIRLRPGTYTVSATSPQYNDGTGRCSANAPAAVGRSGARTADVYCQMK